MNKGPSAHGPMGFAKIIFGNISGKWHPEKWTPRVPKNMFVYIFGKLDPQNWPNGPGPNGPGPNGPAKQARAKWAGPGPGPHMTGIL